MLLCPPAHKGKTKKGGGESIAAAFFHYQITVCLKEAGPARSPALRPAVYRPYLDEDDDSELVRPIAEGSAVFPGQPAFVSRLLVDIPAVQVSQFVFAIRSQTLKVIDFIFYPREGLFRCLDIGQKHGSFGGGQFAMDQ